MKTLKTLYRPIFLLFALLISINVWSLPESEDPPFMLWYNQPAAEWTEALPLGNGRLGAMVYGTIQQERIQLNEESLWAGQPVDAHPPEFREHLPEIQEALLNDNPARAKKLMQQYGTQRPTSFRSYQPLGDILLSFEGLNDTNNYRRELNLNTGISNVAFDSEGQHHTRETFISATDDVLVIRLQAGDRDKLNLDIHLTRSKDAQTKAADNNTLIFKGQIIDRKPPEGPEPNPGGSGPGGKHMRFGGVLKASTEGGSIISRDSTLQIKEASQVTILFSAATDYDLSTMNFDRTTDPVAKARATVNNAMQKPYRVLRRHHVAEHREMFERVDLNLGQSQQDNLPTNKRLEALKEDKADPALVALMFQYGRYLLMNSSRYPARLPANLQGVWNKEMWAPWEADYHLNINLQMNYWPHNPGNLPETIIPYLNFAESLAEHGKETARKMYGADGWVVHHCTNVFGRTTPSGSTEESQINNGYFPVAGAWFLMPLWRHYEFYRDKQLLEERIYPLMKGSAEFILDFLIENEQGQLVTAPSHSPENLYIHPETGEPQRLTVAATMDIQIIHTLFSACIQAADILGKDAGLKEKLRTAREKLPPVQIGDDGTIQEWIRDYEEENPGHRHISHLFGLYPGTTIHPGKPELFKAAEKTIERRLAHGGGHTGWSRAWIISLFARLQDEERAHENALALLKESTLTNLFDTHPPFQIDGNFGFTAGISEMLMQSHRDTIRILPALPDKWEKGYIRGLQARGNFRVDIHWDNHKLRRVAVTSKQGNMCTLRYRDSTITFNTREGKTYVFDNNLLPIDED
ncbi:MAG: glycoside hydrolase family 95 protein [Bacteroidales bacterium]|nr:glycoside hydrolase family 95 protein [Bacteroidales bacterium]